MIMKKVLTLIAILFICGNCSAVTVYISVTGNNANAGTIGSPWRTLTYASTHTSSGDIINVGIGTFLEAGQVFIIPGVSIEGAGITSILTTSWTTSFNAFIVMISVEGTNGNQHISNVKIDGRSLATPRGVDIEGRSNVSVHDCTISNFKEEGVIFNGAASFTSLPPSIYATGNLFYNNIVTDCSLYSGFGRGELSVGGQDGMLIHDNNISQPARTSPNQVGWPIKYYNEGWLRGCKIYNNILYKDPTAESGWNFAFEWFNSRGTEIYNNTVTGSMDFNFQGDRTGYPYVLYFHDNTISSPVGTGRIEQGLIFEYDLDSTIIENNTFTNLANVISFYCRPATRTSHVKIQKNLFANVGYPPSVGNGYMIGGFDAGTNNYTIDSFYVYNNTMVGNIAVRSNQGIGFGNVTTGHIQDVDCRDNILTNIVYPPFSIGGTATKNRVNISYNNGFTTDQFGIGTNGVYLVNGAPTNYTNTNYTQLTPGFADSNTYPLKSTSLMRSVGQNVGNGTDLGWKQFSNVVNPIANAGSNQTITLPTNSVTMAGSGTAGTYSIVSHVWTQIGGTTAIITIPTSYTTTITGLGAADTYTFRLTVIDSMGNTDHDDMSVTVTGSGVIKQYILSAKKFVNAQ